MVYRGVHCIIMWLLHMTGAHDPGVEPGFWCPKCISILYSPLFLSFRGRMSYIYIWKVLLYARSNNTIKDSPRCPVGPAVFRPMTYAQASRLQLWTGVGMKTFSPKTPDAVSILGKSPVFPVIPESWGSSRNHSMLRKQRSKNQMKPMTWIKQIPCPIEYISSPKNAILEIYTQGHIPLYHRPLYSIPT